ncbi:IS5 family transposase [Paraburkholderia sp. CNPSo 3155]|uniref:IS5 family transposase n=1 Tax=Paraburkholderia atlantica TaxID=2654982 RepID=UPI00128C86AF|nr:IS5 family transposase [Paraburkholderia atlantica]MPW11070.1 IS5 family transposase [Paraburkholderia atlantica]
MPYKVRQKQGEPRKWEKAGYRVTNAHAYNQSLKKRGMISLYVPHGDLKAQFINTITRTRGVSGREPTYTAGYIELIYTFYRLFGWGMRQTTGYMQDYWATRGQDIAVPSFGQLCDRFAALEASVTQRCEQLARRLARGEAVSLIVDSTGLSFARAGQWYEEKYGKKADRTPWRKMHLSIDADMNIHAIRITTTEVSDSEGMDAMLPADLPVDRVIADGAYYSIERGEALSGAGITPVIPPPAHAIVHGDGQTRWHDELVRYIKDKGIYAFHKKYGYGLRSRVEAQISRIKRCIGATLLTQKIASQECEGVIIANLINLWNSFGRSVCVKNG